MQRKFFLIEFLSLFVIILSLVLSGIVITLLISDFKIIFLIILVTTWGFTVFWFYYYTKIGFKGIKFGCDWLPPNIFQLQNMKHDDLTEKLSRYFKSEWNIIKDDENETISYMLAEKGGLKLRILSLRPEKFDKETFKEIKQSSNRRINKQNNISDETPIGEEHKPVRINFVILDAPNEYSDELSTRNADTLFGRVEGILPLFFYENEGVLCFPAHFGLSAFTKYNKLYRIIERFAKECQAKVSP